MSERKSGRRLLAMTMTALLSGAGLIGVGAVAANAAEADADPAQTTLSWGIKQSFLRYINGPIAHGSVSVSGNVVDNTAPFQFTNGTGTVDEGASANVSFDGSVHFEGHDYGNGAILDLEFSNVRVDTASDTVFVDVEGREFVDTTTLGPWFTQTNVPIADLTGTSWSGNTYTASGASITAAGAEAFGGFYSAGDAMDGLSLTVVPQEVVAEPVIASVTASVTSADESGLAISADVQGVDDTNLPNGVHVGLIPSELENASRADFLGIASQAQIPEDGNFSANFTAAAEGLDPESSYDVIVWPQRQNVTPENTIARTTLSVSEEQWSAVFPEQEPVFEPQLTVEPATGLNPEGDTVTVTGTGYNPEQAIYVFLCGEIELPANLWNHALGCTSGAKVIYPVGDTNPERATFDADGSFEIEFAVRQLNEGATSVFTAANHTAMGDRGQDAKATLEFSTTPEPEPQDPAVEFAVTEVANERVDIAISGTGFGDVQALPGQNAPHVYFTLVERGGDLSEVAAGDTAVSTTVDGEGNLSGLLSVPAEQLDESAEYDLISWPSRSEPSENNLYTRDAVTIDWAALFPAEEEQNVAFSWGVKQSFRNYVGGPIAHGTIHFNGVEMEPGDVFTFEDGEIISDVNPTEVQFEGTITFEGHDGILFVEIRDPRVVINADGSGSIFADVLSKEFINTTTEGELVEYPNVELVTFEGEAAQAANAGSLLYAVTAALETINVAETALTEAGVPAFGGFYPAGEAFDGFELTVPAAGSEEPEPVRVTAAAPSRDGNVVTIPDVEGVVYSDADGSELSGDVTLVEDQTLTVTATAADGYVLTDGQHTWEFVYEAEGTPEQPDPDASYDWQLIWGLKESFRKYVVGPIAHGSISTSGKASQAEGNGEFSWTEGKDLDEDNPGSNVQFSGKVTLQGHGGILYMEISNPRIVSDANGNGSIYATVSSKEFIDTVTEGDLIRYGEVEFATFTGGAWNGGKEPKLVVENVRLTEDGADAFGGFYETGESLDRFTLNSVEHNVPGGGGDDNRDDEDRDNDNNTGTGGNNNTGGDSELCVAYEVSGNLNWALKDSFLDYIQGGIAKGSINTSGVAFSGGSFGWNGSGQLNTNDMLGDVSFPGTVHFTGHDGVLDTKISNVRLVIHSGSQASIYANVVSNDMEGNSHNLSNVRFAAVNISGASLTSDSFSVSGASTTLTADGAKAFAGFYESGTALAPVSFSLALGNEVPCSSAVNPTGEGLAQTGFNNAPILALLAVAVVLMALGARSVTIAQRRRS